MQRRRISKNCGYAEKNTNKAGFKKAIISPFHSNFHAIPTGKENSCFIPATSIPRLKILYEILPNFADEETEALIKHERQHCLAESFLFQKIRIEKNINEEIKETDIESITNHQVLREIAGKEGADMDEEEMFSFAAKVYLYSQILSEGAQILETRKEEEMINWLKYCYLFQENDVSLEKYKGLGSKFLDEYFSLKIENKTKDFFDKFIDKAKEHGNEIIQKYNEYMKENKIYDLYDQEDRECEILREKIIEFLNKEKIL